MLVEEVDHAEGAVRVDAGEDQQVAVAALRTRRAAPPRRPLSPDPEN
ncbi:hypothetical protein [Planomonospora sphaerica]|nr:hypothetical protein [Planomonospora sphaerica]